jgi:hypothetical protein
VVSQLSAAASAPLAPTNMNVKPATTGAMAPMVVRFMLNPP